MTRAEEFEQLRALLFAIAYRILGSVSEAEDAVQETWLRYEASLTHREMAHFYAGTGLGPVHLSVTDGGRALCASGRTASRAETPQHREKAITLTPLRNAAGLPLVPPFRERSKPWLKPSFEGA